MRYDSLPFITVSASMDKETVFPMLHSYAPYGSEFLLYELSKMLTGDFKLEGEISVLPNLMASQHALDQLMYVQAFMIFNASAGYYTEREGLDSYELRYTLSGEGVLEYEGKKYTLKEGDGYFISCQKPHIYYSGKNGWKSTVLHINGGLCNDFFERYAKDGQYRISKDTMPSFETMQFQVLQATQKVHPYQEYRINCLLDLLLTELLTSTESLSAGQKGNSSEVISTLLDYIHSHYTEDIVFEKMAKTFGISRTLLFSEFKRYTGFTPAVYLMKIRIRQAKLLLAKGEQPFGFQRQLRVPQMMVAHDGEVFRFFNSEYGHCKTSFPLKMGMKKGRPPVKVRRPRQPAAWQIPGRWHYSILSF